MLRHHNQPSNRLHCRLAKKSILRQTKVSSQKIHRGGDWLLFLSYCLPIVLVLCALCVYYAVSYVSIKLVRHFPVQDSFSLLYNYSRLATRLLIIKYESRCICILQLHKTVERYLTSTVYEIRFRILDTTPYFISYCENCSDQPNYVNLN